jgi:DNA-binding transcriptional LysR family regulator
VRGQGIISQPQFIVGEAVALGGIHVIYPLERRPPAKVRAMIDYLVEVFEQGPLSAGEPG